MQDHELPRRKVLKMAAMMAGATIAAQASGAASTAKSKGESSDNAGDERTMGNVRQDRASAITELTQLVLRERGGRDRSWWNQMAACYHADATVELSWYRGSAAGFIKASKEMGARGKKAIHRLSPPVVHLKGSRAVVELPAAVEIRTVFEGVEVDVIAYTRLLYRVAEHDGVWLIHALKVIYERDTLTAVIPSTPIKLDVDLLNSVRPPYRYLAYSVANTQYAVRDDLYGDDQPKAVEALYAETFAWMHSDTPS